MIQVLIAAPRDGGAGVDQAFSKHRTSLFFHYYSYSY